MSVVDALDGRFVHATRLFAPVYQAPDWRAQWVQRARPSPTG